MATPSQKDVVKLQRIMWYLHSGECIKYGWPSPTNQVTVYSGGDWAGLTRTRKSTSGRVFIHGFHLVSHWSGTQSVVALSSAEAELNTIVKRMAEILGLMNMKRVADPKGQVFSESSAANGIVHRQVRGWEKHFECQQPWVPGISGSGRHMSSQSAHNCRCFDALPEQRRRKAIL